MLTGLTSLAWFVRGGHHALINDEVDYDTLAMNWLHSGAGMSMDGKHPTATVGPVYPAFVAAVYAVFGHNPRIVYVVQIFFAVLAAYIFYRIGERLTGSRLLSTLSAGLFGLYFPLLNYTTLLLTELMFALLLAITVYLTLTAFQKKSLAWFFLSGIVAGITALCRPSVMPMPVLVLVVSLFAFHGQKRLIAGSAVLFAVGAALAITPWTVRNYLVFRSFVPVATEGGYVFWAGNYGKHGDYGNFVRGDKPPAHIQRFEDTNPSEVERNAFYTREAIKIIEHNPGHAAALAGRKFLRLWFSVGYRDPPSRSSLALALGHLILLGLAVYSIKVVKNRPGLLFVWLVLLNFTAIHMITFGNVRYALPIMPYVLILAVSGFARFVPQLANAE